MTKPAPANEVDDPKYRKDIYLLYELFTKIKSVEECKKIFADLLTSSERRMLRRRWHIACLLDEGYDIRKVARLAQVSTATVENVAKKLQAGSEGLSLALQRTRNERKEKFPEERLLPKYAFSPKGMRDPIEDVKDLGKFIFGRGTSEKPAKE